MTLSSSNYLTGVLGVYKRWCTWQRLLYLLVTTSLVGLLTVQTEIADAVIRGEVGLTWQPWVWTFSSVYGYAIISPVLIYCCELWPFGRAYVIKTSIKLVLLYVPITFFFITVMLGLRHIAHLLIDGALFDSWNLLDRYAYEFPKAIAVYIVFVFITYTKIYYDSTKKEQLNAANLAIELQAIRMQTLRSQLQPHFLFNTLNLISSTVYQDADKADSIITRLGDLLRYSLATEQKSFVSLKEELHAMRSYLEISQLRFGERMTVKIDVEPSAEQVPIPAMLLQPLLENAVKYGIEPSDQPGEICLSASIDNEQLNINITNPWHQRRAQQESFGIGLQNAKNRLNLLYKDKASITLDSDNKDQVTLFISLPVQKMEYTHAI
jgi:hypothetical protein